MTRRVVAILLAVTVVALVVANYFIPEPHEYNVRVVNPPTIIASLPHWIAEEEGIYRRHNLTVDTIALSSSTLMVQALVEGSADVLPAVSLVDVMNESVGTVNRPLIFSHSRFPDNPPFEALVVPRGSAIARVRDLAGKTIAVYPGITARAAVLEFLRLNGVDTSTVTIQTLAPPEHLQALQVGDADASHIYEPFRTAVLADGQTRQIYGSVYNDLNPRSPIGASAISSKFLAENREAARSYLEAWDETIRFIRERPERAREVLAEKLGLSPSVAAAAAWVEATQVGEMDLTSVFATVRTFQGLGVISSDVQADSTQFVTRHIR